MVRLKKYIEWMSRGRRTNRIAYVMKEWDLPTPLPGAEWHIDQKFSVADELLRLTRAYVAVGTRAFIARCVAGEK